MVQENLWWKSGRKNTETILKVFYLGMGLKLDMDYHREVNLLLIFFSMIQVKANKPYSEWNKTYDINRYVCPVC